MLIFLVFPIIIYKHLDIKFKTGWMVKIDTLGLDQSLVRIHVCDYLWSIYHGVYAFGCNVWLANLEYV